METIECSKCGAVFEKTGAKDKLRRFKDKRFVATFHCPNCDARVILKKGEEPTVLYLKRLERLKEQAKRIGDRKEVNELQDEIDQINREIKMNAEKTKDKKFSVKGNDAYDPTKPKNIAAAKSLAKAQGAAASEEEAYDPLDPENIAKEKELAKSRGIVASDVSKDSVGASLMYRNGNFIMETDYGDNTGYLDKSDMVQVLRNSGVDSPDNLVNQAERYDARAVRVQLRKVAFKDSKTKDRIIGSYKGFYIAYYENPSDKNLNGEIVDKNDNLVWQGKMGNNMNEFVRLARQKIDSGQLKTRDIKTTDSLFKGQKVTAIKSEQGLREGETYTVLGEEEIIKQIVGENNATVYKLQDSSGNVIVVENPDGLFYEVKDSLVPVRQNMSSKEVEYKVGGQWKPIEGKVKIAYENEQIKYDRADGGYHYYTCEVKDSKTKDEVSIGRYKGFEMYQTKYNSFSATNYSNANVPFVNFSASSIEELKSKIDQHVNRVSRGIMTGNYDSSERVKELEEEIALNTKAGNYNLAEKQKKELEEEKKKETITQTFGDDEKIQGSEEKESLKVKIGDIRKNMDAARKMGFDTAPYQKEIDKLETKTKDDNSKNGYYVGITGKARTENPFTKDTETKYPKIEARNKELMAMSASRLYDIAENAGIDMRDFGGANKATLVDSILFTEFNQNDFRRWQMGDSKTKDGDLDFEVVTTNRNYETKRKIFKTLPQESPSAGENRAREYARKLEEEDKKDPYGIYRSITVKRVGDSKTKDGDREDLEKRIEKLEIVYNNYPEGPQADAIRKQIESLKLEYLQKFKGFKDKKVRDAVGATLSSKDSKIKDSTDFYTKDPLTKKGEKILAAMKKAYGEEKGKQIFYASKNKGTISGVDSKSKNGPSINDPAIRNQIRVALQTLKMPSAMLGVMGGTTKEQAKEILRKYGVKFEDSKMKDWLDPEARVLSEKVLRKMKEIHKRTKQTNIYDLFDDAIRGLGITGKIKEDVRILILQGANHRYTEEFIFKDSKTKDQEIKITIGEDPVNPSPAEQKVESNDVIYKEHTLKQLPETGEFEIYAPDGSIVGHAKALELAKLFVDRIVASKIEG